VDERIMVNIGNGVVAKAPVVISSVGLGSCVALMLYDPGKHIGGLAHILLPCLPDHIGTGESSAELRADTEDGRGIIGGNGKSIYLYADTALMALLKGMMGMGSSPDSIYANIAGGAKMFTDSDQSVNGMGSRNITSVTQFLKRERIPLIGHNTGGSQGRSVDFYLASGRVVIRTFEPMEETILSMPRSRGLESLKAS
jgi:chemotaxis protein CheD